MLGAIESWGRATWPIGAGVEMIQALFVLAIGMSVVAAIHPRMVSEYLGPATTRQLQPPGLLALNYGRGTPFVAVVSHLTYGAILGAFYHLA
jgi:hypothetical protein